MKTMKRRIFSGAICEQIVYNVTDRVRDPKEYDPEKTTRIRFKTEWCCSGSENPMGY